MENTLSGGEEYDELIGTIRKICKFITIWPLELSDVDGDLVKFERARKLQNFCKLFISIFMLLLTVVQLADVVRNWGKVEEFTECCIIASSCLLALFRLLMYSIHQKNVNFILERMRYDWVSGSEEDRILLRKKCRPAFTMTKYFISSVTATMSVALFSPALAIIFQISDERKLPYGGYFYFDVSETPIYEILYAVKILGGIFGACNVTGLNSLNLITITHASAKFVLLRSHLGALKSDDKKSEQLLRSAIQEHQKAIEFADILEEIINKIAFGLFIVSTGLICFAGLQITEMMDNKIHLIKHSAYLGSAIFQLFLFSYSGYQLSSESELVKDSAFNSDWVGSKLTQNLHILMMRAEKPSTITAAKFYDMSLESFCTVLSTSFSYFTTLRATIE